jgi:hypothetical protein
MSIGLNEKAQDKLIVKFLNHFSLETKLDDVRIIHPTVTNRGCIHIDVGSVKEKGFSYYFSFGCSARLMPQDERFVETYIKTKDDIDYSDFIFDVTNFNNKNLQLCLLSNGEYIYYDREDNELRVYSNDAVCGLYVYDSFSLKEEGENITYLELIPATKQELDFIESHNDVHYKDFIIAFKPYLGNRESLANVIGLSIEQMESIYKTLKNK